MSFTFLLLGKGIILKREDFPWHHRNLIKWDFKSRILNNTMDAILHGCFRSYKNSLCGFLLLDQIVLGHCNTRLVNYLQNHQRWQSLWMFCQIRKENNTISQDTSRIWITFSFQRKNKSTAKNGKMPLEMLVETDTDMAKPSHLPECLNCKPHLPSIYLLSPLFQPTQF